MRRQRWSLIGVVAGLLVGLATCGWSLSADDMVDRVAAINPTLKDYQVMLNLAIAGPSIEAPRIVVKLSYKKPDKLRFDPVSGFAVLPRKQVLFGNPLAQLRKHAKVYYIGERVLGGRKCYVVKVVSTLPEPPSPSPDDSPEGPPRHRPRPQPTPIFVWLDEERFTLEQVRIKDQSMELLARFTNAKYSGQWWLPQSVKVTIKGMEEEPTVVDLKFKDYKLNIGLQDSFFPTPAAPR